MNERIPDPSSLISPASSSAFDDGPAVGRFDSDESAMRRALELARRGLGSVEPNPPVGAVVVDGEGRLLGEGFHERFGGPHAEVNALQAAGEDARGATLFVTLEPCRHHGKTGPCTQAVIAAGIRRVVVGTLDPNPTVSGQGVAELRAAGLEVEVGLLADECRRTIAPFARWVTTGRPWVHAKWAMSLDGRLATHEGASRWISNESSRRCVHRLRGRVDAVVVGSRTAEIDDPLLTARPPGPRTATRVVVSRSARLARNSQLVQTAGDVPVIVTALSADVQAHASQPVGQRPQADELAAAGVEVLPLAEPLLDSLLRELGRRGMMNVLVEGGGDLLGALWDAGLMDEVHVFIAPKLIGGRGAVSPIGGTGRGSVSEHPDLDDVSVELLDGDVYVHGFLHRN